MKLLRVFGNRFSSRYDSVPGSQQAKAAKAERPANAADPAQSWAIAENRGKQPPLALTAPVAPPAVVDETLKRLATEKRWLQIATYLRRIPEQRRHLPVFQMWRAIAMLKSGQRAAGRRAILRAAVRPDDYHVAPTALTVLQQHMNVSELLKSVIAATKEGTRTPAAAIFACAMLFHQKRMEEAERLMAETADIFQDDPKFLLLRARTNKAMKQHEIAAELAFRAHELDPEQVSYALFCMDTAWGHPGDNWLEKAVEIGAQLLKSDHPRKMRQRIVITQARLCNRLLDHDKALGHLKRLSETEELDEIAMTTLVGGLVAKSEHEQAVKLLERRLKANRGDVPAILQMAGVLAAQASADEALDLLQNQLPEARKNADTSALIGHLYAWNGRTDEARPWLQKALEADIQNVNALADLSFCAEMRQEYTLALTLADRASVLLEAFKPTHFLGFDLIHQLRLRRRMIFTAMMAGLNDLAAALQMDGMRRKPLELPYQFQEWQGGSVAGKSVIAVAELGIGDEIRYTSVYPRLLADAKEVWLTCDPRLETLLARSFPKFNVVPVQREFPGIKARRLDERKLSVNAEMRRMLSDDIIEQGRSADIWMRVIHQFEFDAIANRGHIGSPDQPVLIPNPDMVRKFRQQLDRQAKGRKVIGLSWRGGRRTYSRDPHYFKLEQWGPILRDRDACFVNLQYSIRDEELDWLRQVLGERLIEFSDLDLFDDMEGVAALSSQLDLVVAICTNVLELAGAVGAPTLYLMRSPQVTHLIRAHGMPDRHGVRRDNVWSSCRILPRIDMTDDDMIARACDFIDGTILASAGPAVHLRQS